MCGHHQSSLLQIGNMFWQLYIKPLFQLSNCFWLQIWTNCKPLKFGAGWAQAAFCVPVQCGGYILGMISPHWFEQVLWLHYTSVLPQPMWHWLLEPYCHHLAHQLISVGLMRRKDMYRSNKPWPPMARPRVRYMNTAALHIQEDTKDPLAMLPNE